MTDRQAHPDFEVAIIGAGTGGIAAAVKVAGARHRRLRDNRTRHRGAARVEVRQEVHAVYRDLIVKRSRALRYYFNDLNGHVPAYYRNSQCDSTYVRPTGFFAASRADRQFSFDDYQYEPSCDGASPAVHRWAR